MWHTQAPTESNGRIVKLLFRDASGPLRFSNVLEQLRDNRDFRAYFIDQLNAVPFDAYRWETPAVTEINIDREFECVVLNAPGLGKNPDVSAFSQYFRTHAIDDVAVFPNLGGDAILVVPCPVITETAYGHLAAFHRLAPGHQKHSLWQRVGETMLQYVGEKPVWLNTAGGGVSWLHVRLDSRPKYYGYTPYKSPPQSGERGRRG